LTVEATTRVVTRHAATRHAAMTHEVMTREVMTHAICFLIFCQSPSSLQTNDVIKAITANS
jgi:hypothetical protein